MIVRKLILILILIILFFCGEQSNPIGCKNNIIYEGLSSNVLDSEGKGIHQKLIGEWVIYAHQCDQYCYLTNQEFMSYYGHIFKITEDYFHFPCNSIKVCKDSKENLSDHCDIEEMSLSKSTVLDYTISNHDNLVDSKFGDKEDDLYFISVGCKKKGSFKFSGLMFNPAKETFSMGYNDNEFFLKRVISNSVDKTKKE